MVVAQFENSGSSLRTSIIILFLFDDILLGGGGSLQRMHLHRGMLGKHQSWATNQSAVQRGHSKTTLLYPNRSRNDLVGDTTLIRL